MASEMNVREKTIAILKYCKKHKLKTLPVNLKVKDGEKEYLNGKQGRFKDGRYNFTTDDFKKLTYKECKAFTEHYLDETDWIAIDTTNTCQLDIDFGSKDDTVEKRKEIFEKWVNDPIHILYFQESHNIDLKQVPYYLSASKKLPHYFLNNSNRITKKRYYIDGLPFQTNESLEINYSDMEVLDGQWAFANKNELVYNCDEPIPEIAFVERVEVKEEKKTANKPKKSNKNVDVSVNLQSNEPIDPMKAEILQNIDEEKYYNYAEWTKFIWAIKFTFPSNIAEKVAIEYSKKNEEKFKSEEDVIKTMESENEARIGWGYLMNLSKSSNKDKHYSIVAKYNKCYDKDDHSLAQLAIQLLENNIIRDNDDQFYVYRPPYWVKDKCKEVYVEVCNILREFYCQLITSVTEQIKFADDEEKDRLMERKKKLDHILVKINNHYTAKNVAEEFRIYLEKSEIHFDTYKPYYFCFTNCAYDLETNKLVKVKRENYISQTTRYAYRPATPKELDTIKKLFDQIFPVKDDLICFQSILRTCLIAIHMEHFILANGGGGNGKGLLSSIMEKMMGKEYFYRASVTILTEKQKKGADQDLANLHKKRMVVVTEPDNNACLCLGTLKGLTGDGTFNARALYKEESEVRLFLTLIMECNKKPKLGGKSDNALVRRFINLWFKSTFTEKSDVEKFEDKEDCYYFEKNEDFKTENWQQQHKFALFDYLMSFTHTTIEIPESIKNSTYKYLIENDDLCYWLDQNYVLMDNGNNMPDFTWRIRLKDIKDNYKGSQLNQNSRDYRQLTTDKFLQMLKENIKWKKVVSERYYDRYRSNGIDERTVFIGVKEQRADDSDADNSYDEGED